MILYVLMAFISECPFLALIFQFLFVIIFGPKADDNELVALSLRSGV